MAAIAPKSIDAIERKIPISFVATVAATETGNFQFKDAPTAKAANNFFGMHANENYMKQNPKGFLTTTGGANLRKFADSKESINHDVKKTVTFSSQIEKSLVSVEDEADSNLSTRANTLEFGFDSSTDFIYSRTGKDFIFGVNSAERMRINSSSVT